MEQLYYFLQLERKDRDFLLEAIYHFAKRNSKAIQRKLIEEGFREETTSDNWMDSDIFQGIFMHRRGTLAGMMPTIPRTQTKGENGKETDDTSDTEENHGISLINKYFVK